MTKPPQKKQGQKNSRPHSDEETPLSNTNITNPKYPLPFP
jgi:hypothetical protein